MVQVIDLRPGGEGRHVLLDVGHGHAHGVDDAVDSGVTLGIAENLGKCPVSLSVTLGVVFQTEGVDGKDVCAQFLESPYQGVDGLQVAAHPVGAVKQNSDVGAVWLKPAFDEVFGIHAFRFVGMINPLPGHFSGRFVAVLRPEV